MASYRYDTGERGEKEREGGGRDDGVGEGWSEDTNSGHSSLPS